MAWVWFDWQHVSKAGRQVWRGEVCVYKWWLDLSWKRVKGSMYGSSVCCGSFESYQSRNIGAWGSSMSASWGAHQTLRLGTRLIKHIWTGWTDCCGLSVQWDFCPVSKRWKEGVKLGTRGAASSSTTIRGMGSMETRYIVDKPDTLWGLVI